MQSVNRYKKFVDEPVDSVILNIRYGRIKCSRKAGLVKVNNKGKINLSGKLLNEDR